MAVGMIVSYMPWFPSFYRQVTSVNAGYWIPEISAEYSQDFNAIWFFDSEWQPDIDPAVLEANGLIMEYEGHYGIEHNEFDIYKIYRQ